MGNDNNRVRANMRRIQRVIVGKLTGWGYDVCISYSGRTKSRYLEIKLNKWRRLKIRISDHPSKRWWKYDYDVYTEAPRRNALNCGDIIKELEEVVKK